MDTRNRRLRPKPISVIIHPEVLPEVLPDSDSTERIEYIYAYIYSDGILFSYNNHLVLDTAFR